MCKSNFTKYKRTKRKCNKGDWLYGKYVKKRINLDSQVNSHEWRKDGKRSMTQLMSLHVTITFVNTETAGPQKLGTNRKDLSERIWGLNLSHEGTTKQTPRDIYNTTLNDKHMWTKIQPQKNFYPTELSKEGNRDRL